MSKKNRTAKGGMNIRNIECADGTARLREDIEIHTASGDATLSDESPVFSHRPVLLWECIEGLDIKPNGIYVDGTAGGGGHSSEIAKRLSEGEGRLIAIDRDSEAIEACTARLAKFSDRVTLVHDNYRNLENILSSLEIEKIDGILLDLGVSSHQIDIVERGFSYSAKEDAPLDMRMSRDSDFSAYDVVNGYSEEELKRILYEYGEEKFASRIASKIVSAREVSPIKTTRELSELVKSAVPAASVEKGSHPAKRTFQAIRIEVNGELEGITPALTSAISALRPGGRIAVITFHSLEDRIVKRVFAEAAKGCECPPDFPICVCGKKPTLKLVNKKPIVSGENELSENSRARSAKLRIAERI